MKNTLKIQRAIKDITQSELAEHIGVSRQTVHSIEAGKYVPSTVLALKLAAFFKVAVEDIFTLEETD